MAGRTVLPLVAASGTALRRSAQPQEASEIGGGVGSEVMLKGRSKEN